MPVDVAKRTLGGEEKSLTVHRRQSLLESAGFVLGNHPAVEFPYLFRLFRWEKRSVVFVKNQRHFLSGDACRLSVEQQVSALHILGENRVF